MLDVCLTCQPLNRYSMTYKVRILENAQEDLDWLRKNDRTGYLKFILWHVSALEFPYV